jgi:hypothetical protein
MSDLTVAWGGAGEGLLQVLQGLVEFVLGPDQRLRRRGVMTSIA